jgi:hypothetical protein
MVWTTESSCLLREAGSGGVEFMHEAPHEYWARRASEEARLALRSSNRASADAHRELARAYRERARMLADLGTIPSSARVAGAR